MGDGYIYNKMVNFHILKRDRTKEISFVNFSTQFPPKPGASTSKTSGIVINILLSLPPRENSRQSRVFRQNKTILLFEKIMFDTCLASWCTVGEQ